MGTGLGPDLGALPPGMDDPLAWSLALVLLVAAAAVALIGAFRALGRARLVEDLPTSRARSAAQGYVELAGRAELLPGEPVVAPLSGRPCVWYGYCVQERHRDSLTGETEWRVIDKGVSDALFRLVDDTGECVVDPDHAEVTPAVRDRWRGTSPRPGGPPPRGRRWPWGGKYLYREELIRPGDPLHAVGTLRSVRGGAEDLTAAERVRELLTAWKRDPARMGTFDANGDGRIDLGEWQAVRHAAGQEVARERARRASQPSIPVLAAGPPGARPYLLAAVSQADLARQYRWRALARLALFVLASSGCVLLLQAVPTG